MNFLSLSKKLFYVFIFLCPFFFVPSSIVSPVMDQKAFLLIGVSVPLIFFLISIFKEKKEVIKGSLPVKLIFGFACSVLISFLLSGHFFADYWGYPIQSDSLFSFTLFLSLFFIASNIFDEEKERMLAYKVFSLGALVLAFLYLYQILIGAQGGVVMTLPNSEESAIIFSLGLIYMLFNLFQNFNLGKDTGNVVKISLSIVFSAVFVVMMYFMGIKLAWLLSAIGLFLVFWKFMQKRKFDINAPEPFIGFILIIFFLVNFLMPIGSIPYLKPLFTAEPVPSFSQSTHILGGVLSSDVTALLFGTGPATFPYNFSLYKDNSFENKDIVYTHPSSAFLLILNNFGIVGALTFSFLIIYFLWFAVKIILKQRKEERDSDEILLISPMIMLFYSLFFYRFSFLIIMMVFLFFGLWVSSREFKKKDYLSHGFSRGLFSVLLIGLIANAYFFFFNYLAEVSYREAALISENKGDFDLLIQKIETADRLFMNNDYNVALSNLYLTKGANMYEEYFDEFSEGRGEVIKKEQAIGFIKKAQVYAEAAIDLDARDYRAWDNLAYIYRNIEFVSGESTGDVVSSYEKAKELAPLNYRIYLAYAQVLEEKGDLVGSFELYKKAYEINPEFEELGDFIKEIEKEIEKIK